MKSHIKSFDQFLLSEEEAKHIEDIEIDDESDEKHERELEDYEKQETDTCPRCGETEGECRCSDDDYWSTQTFHRVEKGEEKSMEPKQKFKKD